MKNIEKTLGRPVNMNSARQIRLAELAAKREAGEIKRGRPVNSESKHAVRKAELEAKRAAGEIKRGRPVEEGSKRQIRLSVKGLVKLGRKPNPESASYQRKMELEAKALRELYNVPEYANVLKAQAISDKAVLYLGEKIPNNMFIGTPNQPMIPIQQQQQMAA